MDSRFTRRRFLTAASAAAVYLALTATVGCQPPEHSSKVRSSRTPKVKPLPDAPFPPDGVWAFRSRPDLDPPVVEVTQRPAMTLPPAISSSPRRKAAQGRA